MNEIYAISVAGLLVALIDFFDLGRGINQYLKNLNKSFIAGVFTGIDPAEGDIRSLDIGSIFTFVFISNLVIVFVVFIDLTISDPSDRGIFDILLGLLVLITIAGLFSVLYSYVLMIIFGFWQSYMNYYLNFGIQTALVKVWLILISPLALAFFPVVVFLIVLIVVNYGIIFLIIYTLSLPKKGILGSLGLLIAASPFFV